METAQALRHQQSVTGGLRPPVEKQIEERICDSHRLTLQLGFEQLQCRLGLPLLLSTVSRKEGAVIIGLSPHLGGGVRHSRHLRCICFGRKERNSGLRSTLRHRLAVVFSGISSRTEGTRLDEKEEEGFAPLRVSVNSMSYE
jgi:hypothetical protein